MKSKKSIQVIAVYAIMILMLIFGNIAVPGFISTNNIAVILREMSFLGICAIGQTLAILTGGIDLSLSNTLLLCNIMSAYIVSGSDKNVPAALLVCLPALIILIRMQKTLSGIAPSAELNDTGD